MSRRNLTCNLDLQSIQKLKYLQLLYKSENMSQTIHVLLSKYVCMNDNTTKILKYQTNRIYKSFSFLPQDFKDLQSYSNKFNCSLAKTLEYLINYMWKREKEYIERLNDLISEDQTSEDQTSEDQT